MSKAAVVTCLKYLVGVGLLAWVVGSNWAPGDGSPGLQGVLQKGVNVAPLLLALAVCLVSVLLTFVRWYILVRAQGLPFTLSAALRLGTIGYALNVFLPGAVGGDVVKAACLAREQSRRTAAVATVVLDRIVGLCGLVWLVALVAGVFHLTGQLGGLTTAPAAAAALETIALIAAGMVAASVVFWVLLGVLPAAWAERFAGKLEGVPKVGRAFAELWRAVWLYRCRGRSVGLALALAMLAHLGFVVGFYLAGLTLTPADEIPRLGAHFLLVPVGMAIQAGFPTPGGLGGGEAGFGWLYALAGCAAAGGVLAALVQRVVVWILGLVGYLVFVAMRPVAAEQRGRFEEVGAALGEVP